MNCHSQIWIDEHAISSRCARASGPGSRWSWNRVHDLPDFVYFNHRST